MEVKTNKIDWKWLLSLLIPLIASIALPFYFEFKSKIKKELSINNELAYKICDISYYKDLNLKLNIDTLPISNLFNATIKIANTGNAPITKGDFADSSILITLPETGRLLKFICLTNIRDFKTDTNYFQNKIIVKPGLLNKGDEFNIQIFYSLNINEDKFPETNCRIMGGTVIYSKFFNHYVEEQTPKYLIRWGFQTDMIISIILYCFVGVWFPLLFLSSKLSGMTITYKSPKEKRIILLVNLFIYVFTFLRIAATVLTNA